MRGFFLIDKEKGMTSFDVVKEVRRLTGIKRVGHAGTLDPLATGLLVLAVGKATKLLEYLIGSDKEYEVMGRFGAVSDTYDAEGGIAEGDSSLSFGKDEILEAIQRNFFGEIEQVPPQYSALKVGGKRAYEIARAGGEVELKARKVVVDEFETLSVDLPVATFRVKCSSGTYIRSLIHDLGQKLGCGAYVEELRRTRVGDFSLLEAVNLGVLNKNIEQAMLSVELLAEKFDSCHLTTEESNGLEDGRSLKSKIFEHDRPVMAFYKGKLVGVLGNAESGGGVKFRKRIF